MRRTIMKLFGAAVGLSISSLVCFHVGSIRAEASATVQSANPLAREFAAEPGDGWKLLSVALLMVALALVGAALMLWRRERDGRPLASGD